jgi:hypothetical protein
MTDFYEDDELVEKVRAAYERGAKGVTGPPPHDPNQRAKAVVEGDAAASSERSKGIAVWPENEPREVIVLSRHNLPPVPAPIRDPRSRIRTEA